MAMVAVMGGDGGSGMVVMVMVMLMAVMVLMACSQPKWQHHKAAHDAVAMQLMMHSLPQASSNKEEHEYLQNASMKRKR